MFATNVTVIWPEYLPMHRNPKQTAIKANILSRWQIPAVTKPKICSYIRDIHRVDENTKTCIELRQYRPNRRRKYTARSGLRGAG